MLYDRLQTCHGLPTRVHRIVYYPERLAPLQAAAEAAGDAAVAACEGSVQAQEQVVALQHAVSAQAKASEAQAKSHAAQEDGKEDDDDERAPKADATRAFVEASKAGGEMGSKRGGAGSSFKSSSPGNSVEHSGRVSYRARPQQGAAAASAFSSLSIGARTSSFTSSNSSIAT